VGKAGWSLRNDAPRGGEKRSGYFFILWSPKNHSFFFFFCKSEKLGTWEHMNLATKLLEQC
jgi:hypothetical protein